MGKHSLIRNPVTDGYSFGRIKNLKIPREPQLASVEAEIYLFLGFHKGTGFGLRHIRHEHGNEILNAGFSRIEDYVALILRPGTTLLHS